MIGAPSCKSVPSLPAGPRLGLGWTFSNGNESFGAWRESVHDDLVLSTAMAVWQAENRPQPTKHFVNRIREL